MEISCDWCDKVLVPEEGDYEMTYDEMLSYYGWYQDYLLRLCPDCREE